MASNAQETKTKTATKAKVKAKPKAAVKKQKPAKDVLNNIDGIVEVVILDNDLFNVLYDEALLEDAAIIAALEDEGYDAELMVCGC